MVLKLPGLEPERCPTHDLQQAELHCVRTRYVRNIPGKLLRQNPALRVPDVPIYPKPPPTQFTSHCDFCKTIVRFGHCVGVQRMAFAFSSPQRRTPSAWRRALRGYSNLRATPLAASRFCTKSDQCLIMVSARRWQCLKMCSSQAQIKALLRR